MRYLLAVLSAAPLAACAAGATGPLQAAEFRDRRVVGAAAEVTLVAEGDDVGSLSIASGGAFRTQLGANRRPVLHVRFTLRNGDSGPMVVPFDSLVVTGAGEDPIRPLEVFADGARLSGAQVEVAAGSQRRLELVFPLASSTQAAALRGFELAWTVRAPSETLHDTTRFTADGAADPGAFRASR